MRGTKILLAVLVVLVAVGVALYSNEVYERHQVAKAIERERLEDRMREWRVNATIFCHGDDYANWNLDRLSVEFQRLMKAEPVRSPFTPKREEAWIQWNGHKECVLSKHQLLVLAKEQN